MCIRDRYRNLKLKYDTIAQQVQAEEEEISKTLGLFDTLMKAVDENLSCLLYTSRCV